MDYSPTKFAVSLVSGFCAGTLTDLTAYPLDTIKTRLQSYKCLNPYSIKGIYNGIWYNVTSSAITTSIFFGVYDYVKAKLIANNLNPYCSYMIAAGLSDFAATLFRNPFEVIKQNLQVGTPSKELYSSIFKSPIKLYTGWLALVCREVPYSIIELTLYEKLKQMYHSHGNLSHCINGCVAGVITGFITNPIDVVKTRMMIGEGNTYANSMKMLVGEGIKGFFKGNIARCLYLGVGGIAYFGCYEFCKAYLFAQLNIAKHMES